MPALSRLFARLWPPLGVWRNLDAAVLAVALYTAAVSAVVNRNGLKLPEWAGLTTAVNAIILGVLLGFRYRAAYERWWEGRTLWGRLINDSRNLCLKAAALSGFSADGRRELLRVVPGFAVALRDRLRDGATLRAVPGFADEPATPGHIPLFLAGRAMALFQAERAAGRISEVDVLAATPHLSALMDICGACERIWNTPLPLSYRALLRHGLVLYLLTTPWFVADDLSWTMAVPVMALLAYFLLGIELTAESVEDPFGRDADDLSLTRYCETIRQSAEQVLGGLSS